MVDGEEKCNSVESFVLILGIWLIIGSIIVIVMCCKHNISMSQYYKTFNKTTAQLVNFIEVEDEDELQYEAEFKYVVNDIEYCIKSKETTSKKIYKGSGEGYVESIIYNPENPEEGIIVGEESIVPVAWILVMVATLLLGILLVVIIIKRVIKIGKDGIRAYKALEEYRKNHNVDI